MKTMKFLNIRVLSVLALVVLSLSSCLKDPRFIDFASSPPLIEFPNAAANSNKTLGVSIYTSTIAQTTPILVAPFTAHTPTVLTNGKYVLTVAVNQASANTLGSDIKVTVAVDNSVLTGTAAPSSAAAIALVTPAASSTLIPTYAPLPAASYTISTLTPVIPANQRLAYFTVTIDPTLIGGNLPIAPLVAGGPSTIRNYALRLKITDGGGQQISNYNFITYLITASL